MAGAGPAQDRTGLPTSPTGRVPKWVLDEARGVVVEPEPFRGAAPLMAQPPVAATRTPRRRAVGALVLTVALAGAGTVLVPFLQDDPAPAQVPGGGAAPAVAERPAGAPFPTPGREEAAGPVGRPLAAPELPEGEGYRFLRHQTDGRPVTWSPCRPVRYVVRPDHAPADGAALVAGAVARIRAATGLLVVDEGPTTEAAAADRDAYQPGRYGDRWAPVLITWGAPEELSDFGPDVLARAEAVPVRSPSGDDAYVSGSVRLDPRGLAELAASQGAPAVRAVIVHELAHVLGLDHVDRTSEVMVPRGIAVTELGPGDRAGLAALGGGPCQPDL